MKNDAEIQHRGTPEKHRASPTTEGAGPLGCCHPVGVGLSIAGLVVGAIEVCGLAQFHANPIAQARRADAQRRQAAARKAWNPSDKPEWLDEKTYREKIQPRLAALDVSQIQNALSISEPYALRIRAGRCIPHRRHWLSLAAIVGEAG